jgi:hypothetical protein
MPASVASTVLALLVVLASEVISAHWQGGRKGVAEPGIYRESLFYKLPGDEVSVQSLPIEASQVGYLTYDRGRRLAVLDRRESRGMELLYLEYDGNGARFFFDLFNHPPERCMASTGAEVSQRFPDEVIEVSDHPCLLQSLQVTPPGGGESRFIFKLVWLHPDYPVTYRSSMHLKRVQAALATLPPPPSRLIMAGLHGFPSLEEARAFFDAHTLANLYLAGWEPSHQYRLQAV